MLRNNADVCRCLPMLIFRAWATCGLPVSNPMGHNPKGHLMKFTQRTTSCRFGFELKTHVAWHICNCNLSWPAKRFHGTKRMCEVTFNIYIVGVVSMHSPLSLHSWSIPTVNRLNAQATSTSSLRCVSTFQSGCVRGGLHKVLLLKTR